MSAEVPVSIADSDLLQKLPPFHRNFFNVKVTGSIALEKVLEAEES